MRPEKALLVKKHFAETAKSMILASGVESISVRKVAKKAGYAYGTIYNHFKNLDELLWLTRDLFIKDIADYLGYEERTYTRKELLTSFQKYTSYYIKNRNAFSFLYFHKLDPKFKYKPNLVEESSFNENHMKNLVSLSSSEGITIERAGDIIKAVNFAVHGLLTLCFSENDQIKVQDIDREVQNIVETLF